MGANADLARRWFDEVWNQKKDATIEALIAPGVEAWLADDRPVRSAADFKAEWQQLVQAFPDLQIRVDDTVEEGDKVVVRWSVTAMHAGASMGLSPTFTNVAIRGMTWMEISQGRIVRAWDSWNVGGLMQQLSQPAAKTH